MCIMAGGGALRLRQVRNSVAFSLSLCEENVVCYSVTMLIYYY